LSRRAKPREQPPSCEPRTCEKKKEKREACLCGFWGFMQPQEAWDKALRELEAVSVAGWRVCLFFLPLPLRLPGSSKAWRGT
jgi:hypothetical protein